jgi:GNAT superfamily N-acetyltransferase
VSDDAITIAPLDADHWEDLVALFGPERGAYSRCWCMWWRVTGREFDALGGTGRKDALRERAGRTPPWSITCLYVNKAHRRSGVASRLIAGAVELADDHGAAAVEAYPVEVDGDAADSAVFTGTPSMFADVGFEEIARRRHRPIIRRQL